MPARRQNGGLVEVELSGGQPCLQPNTARWATEQATAAAIRDRPWECEAVTLASEPKVHRKQIDGHNIRRAHLLAR